MKQAREKAIMYLRMLGIYAPTQKQIAMVILFGGEL
jgi:hypothetical protein